MSAKQLLLDQTNLAFDGDPELSLKASLKGVTNDLAARQLADETWTIEEIVYHLARCKIEYCKQGFGKWTISYERPMGDFEQMITLLDRSHEHLTDCLESFPESRLSEPLATQNHGQSAAHFFSVMIIHDISHAAQIRTRLRLFGYLKGGYYRV